VVFEQGSLGASGDLVPLAHMTLPLLGEGEVWVNGQRMAGSDYLHSKGLQPYKLRAKEGLAMLNGTQFMLAYGLESLNRAQKSFDNGLAVFALAVDAFDGRKDFLFPGIHQIRPHKGQVMVAEKIAAFLGDSSIANAEKKQVQDPYSVRCLPQVLGASADAIAYVASVFETELNSITDNPLVFREADLVVSGGNFHGQPLALSLDFLAIAVAEVANIAERLMYKLIAGERGLPVFLTSNPGLESGFMIPQYSAAALVSQNKQLATPASVDSIVSSNGQEDHVSMGANAALKLYRVVENTESVLGILLLAAAQALDFRRPATSSAILEKLYSDFREMVSFRQSDETFKPDMDAAKAFIRNYSIES
jgi:histidine ammonia-lyase